MVDDADVSLMVPKLVSSPAFDTSSSASPVGAETSSSGIRLSSLPRAVLESQPVSVDQVAEFGPRFVGHVALATHEQLVAVGHVDNGSIQVWRGTAHHLSIVSEVETPAPLGAVVSLCWYRNEWHLFTRSDAGRSSHLVSTDLREWTSLLQLAHSFPAFAVSGVAVRSGDMLLAGRIFVDNTAFGWGLLRSDGRSFEARPVPLPLATQLSVIGPTVNRHGDAVLLLDSGHNRTVARSTGLGWTLSLLIPAVTPMAAFADGVDLWLVGHDDAAHRPSLARVNVEGVTPLPSSSHGSVRAAIVHGDHLVLAREC